MIRKNVIAWLVLFAAIGFTVSCIPTPIPGTYYVDPAGDDSNDCLSPATACLTIGAAIDKASAGNTIQVMAGNYAEIDAGVPSVGVVVDKDLTINGVGDARIGGGGARTVVSIWPGTSAVMTNLVIHNGGGQAVGGIMIGTGSSLELSNSTVRNNMGDSLVPGPGFFNTGGIHNRGTLIMSNVEVIFNNAIQPPGSQANGGGIFNQGELIATDCQVVMNQAEDHGAGIFNAAGASASLTGCMVDDNLESGGVWNEGELTLHDTTIRANTVFDPSAFICGGISNYDSLTMTGGVVADNGSPGYFGGICNFDAGSVATVEGTFIIENIGGGVVNYGTMSLDSVDIGENTAGGAWNYLTMSINASQVRDHLMTPKGGGIWNVSGTLTIQDTTISGNEVSMWGGGLMNNMDATVFMERSTISGNTADIRGAGIFNEGEIHMTNCTVSGNAAPEGAGIGNNGWMRLSSVTVANNNPDGISSINVGMTNLLNTIVGSNASTDCAGTDFITLGHNLDSDGSCMLIPASGDLVAAAPLLGPLAANGGPTLTHALLPGSPAIDTGAGGGDCLATDQRGVPRPQGPACDIGAYEVEEGMGIPVTTLEPGPDGGILRGTSTGNANCRFGPDMSFHVVAIVLEGESFQIEGRSRDGHWLWVVSPNRRGHCFIGIRLIEFPGNPDDLSEAPEVATQTPAPQGCYVSGATHGDLICVVPCPEGAQPGTPCTP
ncbi:MAG: choice-of-anchor Q domain-containing protein [Anaerolineales bacterium]